MSNDAKLFLEEFYFMMKEKVISAVSVKDKEKATSRGISLLYLQHFSARVNELLGYPSIHQCSWVPCSLQSAQPITCPMCYECTYHSVCLFTDIKENIGMTTFIASETVQQCRYCFYTDMSIIPPINFDDLNMMGHLKVESHIRRLGTFQGRLIGTSHDSTDACTVISLLIVSTHINHESKSGITDNQVNDIIDNRSTPIIDLIRKQKEATRTISLDEASDMLRSLNMLSKECFADFFTGNIFDSEVRKLVWDSFDRGVNDTKSALCKLPSLIILYET